jgi:hypothetical protein
MSIIQTNRRYVGKKYFPKTIPKYKPKHLEQIAMGLPAILKHRSGIWWHSVPKNNLKNSICDTASKTAMDIIVIEARRAIFKKAETNTPAFSIVIDFSFSF